MPDHERLDPEIADHYAEVSERQRLGPLSLERVRTWELLVRHLPPAPAGWSGPTPASTPSCCWAPCTTSPTAPTGSRP
jgi:hypothetical protein